MAFYPAQLQSANLEQFGIVYADEVQGHKTVANLEALYDVSDAILSKSTTNAGNDALGQQWYVVSEGCYYRLDNWANRNQASGWRKMQNVDEEFDSLQEHGADKIKSFTTTSDTVSLNYNTWKNSTTSVDGSVTIPAATGDQAGVLTANGKDQLTQLNKLGEVTHLTDGGVFTEEASTVTVHYKCINTKEGATSAVVTKSEAIPEATLTNAGVLSAAKRNQLEQLDKIGEVTHLTDSGVFTTDANTVTLHYQCVDTNSGANSAVSTKTAVIPEATLTKAGTLAASNRNQLEQLNKITAVSHIADEQAFTSNANNVALNFKCILTTDGSAEDFQEHSVNIPAASSTSAGTMSATDKTEHDRINTANFALGAVTPSATAVAIAASKTNITNGSSVTNNITIPGVTESAAGVMSAADKAKLNDITIPEGGVDFSGDATDVINGAGDSVDLMAKFPATVVTNLTGVTPSASAATINFTRSAKDTLDYNAATSNTVTIPGATTSAAGLMSATDKTEHNRITTTNFTLGAVTPSASTVQIAATKTTISTGASAANNITLPAVTESAAGVMIASDKAKLNDIQFVQSLTATGTQVVAVTSDTVVINSASQLNVTGINANAYNKVRFVNATSINTLFTFNNASAGNNKLLTTYYPSQIALPRYCSVEFVKSSTGWILSDLTGVTYFPDVTASETMVVTVNADRSIGTLPIRTMKEWDETITQEQSVSQLNQRFPDAPVGFQFVCVSINRVYEKFNETNEWISHYIWETGTEGTATSTDKGLMSAADKVKLDTTLPNSIATETSNRTNADNNLRSQINNNKTTIDNYTVNGMKISTNPVLDGADIRLTGYSKPSSTSGIAATDTINAALGKLETGLSNEVTNRTNADSNLQSQITNLKNGKVSSVTKSGTGAVITGGSISGSTLTLTSGNFTFANGSSGNFTVTPPGGVAQTVSIGKPATAGTADVAKSVAWGNVSGKVNASTSTNGLMTTAQVTKLNGIAAGAEVNQNAFSNVVVGGTTIAADAKTDTLTLIAGSNVTLTPNATNDSVTIASSYVNTTYAAGSNLTLSGTTFALASTISLTRVNASSGFFQQSDKRLKSDIKPLEHTIEDICSIPTDSFILNGKQDLGTIAQDLEEKFPEVVSECELKAAEIPNPEDFEKVEKDGETYVLVKEVDYAKLSILALEGIKLLKKEIDELKKELHK